MSDGMGRELAYLSSHATNRYFIPNWGKYFADGTHLNARGADEFTKDIIKELRKRKLIR